MSRARLEAAIAGALLLAAPALAAGASGDARPTGDAGASGTAGSGGYHRLSLFADGDWTLKELEPYAWGNYSVDNDLSQFGAGAGAWKDLDRGLSAKAGAGFYVGRVRETDQTGGSFLLETGVEKAAEGKALGAELRFTDGTIGGPVEPVRYGQVLEGRSGRLRATTGSPELPAYTYTEIAGYGRIPVEKARLGLRAAYGSPSYARSNWSEEVSLKVPFAESWRATAAVAFWQDPASSPESSVYFTLGAMYLF